MKKFLVFMLLMFVGLFTTTALTSCGDDDDDETIQDTRIVGSWQENNTTDGIWVWTFNNNGKGSCNVTDRSSSYSFDYTFKFDGKTLIISGKEDGKSYTDTYKVNFSDNNNIQWIDEDGYTSTLKRVK